MGAHRSFGIEPKRIGILEHIHLQDDLVRQEHQCEGPILVCEVIHPNAHIRVHLLGWTFDAAGNLAFFQARQWLGIFDFIAYCTFKFCNSIKSFLRASRKSTCKFASFSGFSLNIYLNSLYDIRTALNRTYTGQSMRAIG